MKTNKTVFEIYFKSWINNNSFIQSNKINVFLEPIEINGSLAILNFKHYNDAQKFVDFYQKGTKFYKGMNMFFDNEVIKGNERGKVVCRFKHS